MEQQMHVISTRYQLMRESIEMTRRTRHDMRHQIHALCTLYEEGNWEAMGQFLKANQKSLEELENRASVCPYPIMDSVLRYYSDYAKNKGITVITEILLNRDYPFEIMDITSLMGNCIENAIEECLRTRKKDAAIHIQVREKNDMLLIRVENTCAIGETTENGKYVDWKHFPSKKRQGQEGLGLKSMHMIAEKYEGMLVMKEEEGRFVTKIALKIPKTKNK